MTSNPDQPPVQPPGPEPATVRSTWRAEWPLIPLLAAAAALLAIGHERLGQVTDPLLLAVVFAVLFVAIVTAAVRVVRHAEGLAVVLGEPYGTLIMTLSVTCIEVLMIASLMLHGANNPTLARDAMFAVVMVVLNGLVGLALVLGALRYREQSYNLQGARAYLSVIMPLTVLTLVMPDLTVSTPRPALSDAQAVFVLVASLALYVAFLLIQTRRHSAYFQDCETPEDDEAAADAPRPTPGSPLWHSLLLMAFLALAITLAESVAIPIDNAIEVLHLPAALGGVAVAVLVLTPESLGALRAARCNHLQRAVNISLGSVLATIGLTAPAVLAVGLATGHPVDLGLSDANVALLILTLALSILTFSGNRTNVLQGVVHLILFLVYLMLIFAP